jgi:hypothetical protein
MLLKNRKTTIKPCVLVFVIPQIEIIVSVLTEAPFSL